MDNKKCKKVLAALQEHRKLKEAGLLEPIRLQLVLKAFVKDVPAENGMEVPNGRKIPQ